MVEKLVIEGNGLESCSGKLGFFSRMPGIFSENLSSPIHNHGPQYLFISSTWINVCYLLHNITEMHSLDNIERQSLPPERSLTASLPTVSNSSMVDHPN